MDVPTVTSFVASVQAWMRTPIEQRIRCEGKPLINHQTMNTVIASQHTGIESFNIKLTTAIYPIRSIKANDQFRLVCEIKPVTHILLGQCGVV